MKVIHEIMACLKRRIKERELRLEELVGRRRALRAVEKQHEKNEKMKKMNDEVDEEQEKRNGRMKEQLDEGELLREMRRLTRLLSD